MTRSILLFVAAAMMIGVYGCSGSNSHSQSTGQTNAVKSEHPEEHAGHSEHAHEGGDAMTDMQKMKAELAKLSPEDAASAMKQHFCPVSDEMLGIMGPPIKVDVNGKEVWICCEGCKDKLLEDPETYLSKLAQK